MKNIFSTILFFLIVTFSFQKEEVNIKRLNNSFTSKKIAAVIPHIVEMDDSIPNDAILEYTSESGIPIMFSRKISTEVCIDTTCRLLKIELFWNITGSYLGFELPQEEFLSKTEHAKFNAAEYDKLHLLLANPQSELANYSLKELAPKKDTVKNGVDAVSSATIKAILNYIVEGAVYTTYTLWHIVYGPTKREIENITAKKMNADITLELLNSAKTEDRIWALNHFPKQMQINKELQSKLMEFISGNDVYQAERALNTLNPVMLNFEIQGELVNIFQNAGFLQKRLILQKLKEVPAINPIAIQVLSSKLGDLNGSLLKMVLELFKNQQIEDETVVSEISELLKNENRYISSMAYKYLEKVDSLDKKTRRNVEKYKKKMD